MLLDVRFLQNPHRWGSGNDKVGGFINPGKDLEIYNWFRHHCQDVCLWSILHSTQEVSA